MRWRTCRGKSTTAFGLRCCRKQRAAAEHKLRIALWNRCQALPPDDRALALVDMRLPMNPMDSAGFLTTMQCARGAHRWSKAMQRGDEAAELENLMAWRASHGQRPLDRLAGQTNSEEMRALHGKLLPLPMPNVAAFRLVAADPEMTRMAAVGAETIKGNLREVVAEDWERRHSLIMEDDARPLTTGKEGQEPKRSSCFLAGVCLCSGEGPKLQSLTKRVYAAFKAAFPHGSSGRAHAMNGFVVCHLRSSPGAALPKRQRHQRVGVECEEVWFHIGLLYLKPFRMTFSEMRRVAQERPSEGEFPERVSLAAACRFLTDYQATQRLCLSDGWAMQFYLLEDGGRPLPRFFPGEVSATRVAGAPVAVWPLRALRHNAARGGFAASSDSGTGGGSGSEDGSAAGSWSDEAASEASGSAEIAEEGSVEWLQELWGLQQDSLHDDAQDGDDEGVPDPSHGQAPGPDGEQGFAKGDPEQLPDNAREHAQGAVGSGARRSRRPPACMVELTGGTIAFYTSNSVFQAVCSNPFHGACVLSRKNTAAAHMKGKPLGLMAAWLSAAPLVDTKEEHWDLIPSLAADRATRAHHREALVSLPLSADLVSYERPSADGEGTEPEI